MLDVSDKPRTQRNAVAEAIITVSPQVIERIKAGSIPKGDPLEVARVAAVMAAKRTWDIIPFCHPVPVDFVKVEYTVETQKIVIRVTVKGIHRTGMEMEALTAASIAALTIYDMLKMLDDDMEIMKVRLVKKLGGKSDFREAFDRPLRVAVLVMSDSISAGTKSDASGLLIRDRLTNNGLDVCRYEIVPDDREKIISTLRQYCDEDHIDLVVTTGGTGISPRDTTPEAMRDVFEREIPGISEAMRSYGQERTPHSMLSRSCAGQRGNTLIINLPGSKNGVKDSLDALLPGLLHAFPMMWGGGHDKRPNHT